MIPQNNGVWHAVAAYAMWGGLPLYWKLLRHIPASQLMSHRVVWCFFLLAAIVMWKRKITILREAIFSRKTILIYIGAGVLIGANWFLYVWAVNAGFIIETSLGYYINPLLSVLLGVVFLGERLRLAQWISIGMAAAGVVYLAWVHGSPPWIALVLASTFAMYGLLKKLAPLGSLEGLALETGLLVFPVIFYLFYCETMGRGAFLHCGVYSDILIVGAGLVTTVPLLCFAKAVRRIPLSILGILQYIAPTIAFLIGIVIFKEPFNAAQCIGFAIIWSALIFFGAENIVWNRTQSMQSSSIKVIRPK